MQPVQDPAAWLLPLPCFTLRIGWQTTSWYLAPPLRPGAPAHRTECAPLRRTSEPGCGMRRADPSRQTGRPSRAEGHGLPTGPGPPPQPGSRFGHVEETLGTPSRSSAKAVTSAVLPGNSRKRTKRPCLSPSSQQLGGQSPATAADGLHLAGWRRGVRFLTCRCVIHRQSANCANVPEFYLLFYTRACQLPRKVQSGTPWEVAWIWTENRSAVQKPATLKTKTQQLFGGSGGPLQQGRGKQTNPEND